MWNMLVGVSRWLTPTVPNPRRALPFKAVAELIAYRFHPQFLGILSAQVTDFSSHDRQERIGLIQLLQRHRKVILVEHQ